jgi:transcriptional regulator with XRE-family HTH domain
MGLLAMNGRRQRAKRSDPPISGNREVAATKSISIDEHVGSRIRFRRVTRGLTGQQLGERVGAAFQQIGRYEHGADQVTASQLYLIGTALCEPVEFFFKGFSSDANKKPNRRGSLEDEVMHLLDNNTPAHSEAPKLVRYFLGIGSAKKRRAVLHLVKVVASESG